MGKVRVDCFSISLDGFGAGPNQTLDNPLGERGMELHNWFFPTKTIQKNVFGNDGGSDGVDERMAARSSRMSGRGSWAATCSGPCAGRGRMRRGRAGGAIPRPIIATCSC